MSTELQRYESTLILQSSIRKKSIFINKLE